MSNAGPYTLAPGCEVQRLAAGRPAGPPADSMRRGGRDGNQLERIRKEERGARRASAAAETFLRLQGTDATLSQVRMR